MSDLILPFMLPFMRDAFIAGTLLAVPTALLSCYLVLKGWSLMGDAVSHAVLPGIVIAYVVGLPLLFGAFCAGMVCAIGTGWLAQNSRVKRDTILGVVFSGMFGLGIVMFVAIDSDQHLDHILFGNLLGVSAQDLRLAIGVAVGVAGIVAVKWRDLMLHAFDETQARASGLNVALLHYGLLVLLCVTVVATLSAVGIILAVGLLIAPGAIAFLLTRRFGSMLVVAMGVNLVAMLVGIYASFWFDSAPAPTVILVLSIMFVVVFVVKSLRAPVQV